ncbi:hypothetical protein ACS5NO_24940 [Larkinella sp. GY13]|uniref:hypothetical protein n=1 Tax=Larkinella sp. GY13 TaxID=3453720 RepID=UPI003EECC5D8
MPMIWNREVETYKVDVFTSSSLNYTLSIRVELKADGALSAHTVSVRFPASVPADYLNIGVAYTEVQLPFSQFDRIYHLLQTEKPVYFTAYEYDAVRFAGFTTDPEATGEGFRDSDANP